MVKMSPSYHRNRRARIKLEMTREDFEKQRLQAAERKKRQRNNMNDEQKKATLAKEAESKRVKRKESGTAGRREETIHRITTNICQKTKTIRGMYSTIYCRI